MSALILCYHKVGPVGEEGRWLNVEPRRLEDHVRYFARRKERFLLGGDFEIVPPAGVAFTFDDAYASTLAHAPQIFRRHGGVATYYAVTDRIGGRSEWDGEKARPLATLEELIAVQAAGDEVGNHTATHPKLGELSDDEQRQQIVLAHEQMTDLGLRPKSVCYPFGHHNAETGRLVSEAGYGVGMSLRKGLVGLNDDPLMLPRVVVAYSDSLPALLYKIRVRPLLRRIGL